MNKSNAVNVECMEELMEQSKKFEGQFLLLASGIGLSEKYIVRKNPMRFGQVKQLRWSYDY